MVHYTHESQLSIPKISYVSLNAATSAGLIKTSYNRCWSHLQRGLLHLPRVGGSWVCTPQDIERVNEYFKQLELERAAKKRNMLYKLKQEFES
jgi:hypothetical protein